MDNNEIKWWDQSDESSSTENTLDWNPDETSTTETSNEIVKEDKDWGPFTPSESESLGEIKMGSYTPTSQKMYSKLGNVNKVQINTDLYTLNFDLDEILTELNALTLTPMDEVGRYDTDFFKSDYLTQVISTINEISTQYGARLKDVFVYKIKKGDNLLNIYRGKPNNGFIYYLQADQNSSNVINDLSAIGGPSFIQTDPANGILNVFPGWLPYSLSINESENEMIAIAGTFE